MTTYSVYNTQNLEEQSSKRGTQKRVFLLVSLDFKHILIVHMVGAPRAASHLGKEVENVVGALI